MAVGPHTGNFTDSVVALEQAGALTRVADPAALIAWVDTMLDNPAARAAMGAAGVAACARHAELPAQVARTLLHLAELHLAEASPARAA